MFIAYAKLFNKQYIMRNITTSEEKALNLLLDKCTGFPESDHKSPMLYNYIKLLAIIQDKEIKQLDNTLEDTEKVYILTRQFGIIASNIVKSASKENSTTDYFASYYSLEQIIEKELSSEVYLYAKQWGLSVKALYFYKKGDYQKGIDFSLECIALNEYLIRAGVHTLVFRSAEQNRNISRILFKKRDWAMASALSNDLLNYLFNSNPGSLYGAVFSEKYYWDKNLYIREGYAYECFRAAVSQMVQIENKNSDLDLNLFNLMFKDIEIEPSTPDRLIIHNYLELKSCFNAENYGLFIEDLVHYMNEPISQLYDILKISLFLDLIKFITNSNYVFKESLMKLIKHHLEFKLNSNETLRKDISSKNFIANEFNVNN